MSYAVCKTCWELFTYGQIHDAATDKCQNCGGNCVEVGTSHLPKPPGAEELRKAFSSCLSAMALMRSMIKCGEDFTPTSTEAVESAFAAARACGL